MRDIRPSLGIGLIIGLLVPVLATYSYLHVQKYQLRHQLKWQLAQELPDEDLVLLEFSKAEAQNLKWEHDHEFKYQGQMYDIVRIEHRANHIAYWCWPDHEETQLNQHLQDLVAQVCGHHTNRQQQQDALLTFFKQVYFPPASQRPVLRKTALHHIYPIPEVATDLFSPSPLLPPPRISTPNML